MILRILDLKCQMRVLISNSFSSQWPPISYKPTKTPCLVNTIKKDMPRPEVLSKKYLVVLKSKWTFIICIKNSMVTKLLVNTMICIFKRPFRCTKVMDFQVSHPLMCLSTLSIHNSRNLETQQLNWFKTLTVNSRQWLTELLRKSFSVSQLWFQKLWRLLSELSQRKENMPGRLLRLLLIQSKTICSLTIRNTKTTDLKS